MSGIENYWLFIVTAFIFIMTPGIDTIFVLNKSISQGRKAGTYATMGINSGILVHTLFAALGLSILVAQSAFAFSVVKYLGAFYLIYLGVKTLLSQHKTLDFEQNTVDNNANKDNFKAGLITNVLNPKVALFFLSFFPQFIKREFMETPIPFVILGLTYALLGMIWYLGLSYFASFSSDKLKRNPKFNDYLNKFSGIVFILMGIKVALTKR